MRHTFSIKATYLFMSLALVLVGCDKGDKKVEASATLSSATTQTTKVETVPTTSTSTSAITAVASTTTTTAPMVATGNNTAATATIDQIMSMMGSGMVMANKMTQKTEGKPKFSAEQISCMTNKGNENAVNDMQVFLQQNFSEAEMKQMNDYYASPTGKHQSELTKNMIAVMAKDSKDTKAIGSLQPTAQEQKEMAAFWKSTTGTKLQTLLQDKENLRPMMTKVMEKKAAECHLAKS